MFQSEITMVPAGYLQAPFLLVSLGVEKIPRFYRGKKKRVEQQKEGEIYASPVDVKTLLKIIAQHRKKCHDPFTGCSACYAII